MSRPHYKTLEDVPHHVEIEYVQSRYHFSSPPLPPRLGTAVEGINYVTFDRLDPETHNRWKS